MGGGEARAAELAEWQIPDRRRRREGRRKGRRERGGRKKGSPISRKGKERERGKVRRNPSDNKWCTIRGPLGGERGAWT